MSLRGPGTGGGSGGSGCHGSSGCTSLTGAVTRAAKGFSFLIEFLRILRSLRLYNAAGADLKSNEFLV